MTDSQGRWRLDGPIVWTRELVQRLEAFEDKIARAINHWLDRVIGGFITKFAVNTSISYSEVEWCFFKRPWGKYLRSLNKWIKMLLCRKRVMSFPWCLDLREVDGTLETKKKKVVNTTHWLDILQVRTKEWCMPHHEAMSSW